MRREFNRGKHGDQLIEPPVRLEFPILSGESAPPVWRQPNVDHVGSWRATAPRRPAARRCCMNTRCEWGGVARISRDPPQEPHCRDEVEGSSHV